MTTPVTIPAIPSTVDPSIRRAFNAVRQSLIDAQKSSFSMQDLVDIGAVADNGIIGTPAVITSTPPKPSGLVASGGFASIILSWDEPYYVYLAYARVYRSTTSVFPGEGGAVGTTQGTVYADTPPSASLSVTYYYWVRFVSTADVQGPLSDSVNGSTADDPAYMLEVLTGQIKEGQLYNDLASRINLIDAAGTGLVSRLTAAETLLGSVGGLITSAFDSSSEYEVGRLVSYNGNVYQCIQTIEFPPLSSAPAPTNASYWESVGAYADIGEVLVALSSGLSDVQYHADISDGIITASAEEISLLKVAVYDPTTGLTSKASINELNSIFTTQFSALSTAVKQVSTTLNGKTTTVESAMQSVDGILGEYTIKIDANGVVAGIGLINGPQGSEFGVRAGKFYIVDPAAPASQVIPFIVTGGKVYIDTLLVRDLTATNIRANSITADRFHATTFEAAVATITNAQLTNVWIGGTIQSDIYDSSTGWSIGKDGTAIFNDITARGNIEASSIGAVCPVPMANITDLLVDTLQIKGHAVTFPVGANLSSPLLVNMSSDVGWSDTGVQVTVTVPTGQAFPVSLAATLAAEIAINFYGVYDAKMFMRVVKNTPGAPTTWTQVGPTREVLKLNYLDLGSDDGGGA